MTNSELPRGTVIPITPVAAPAARGLPNPVEIRFDDERSCTPYDCIEVFVRCDVRRDGTREYYDRRGVRRCKQLFHDNGKLYSQLFYDTKTGTDLTDRTNFDRNGKLCAIIPYKDGARHGQVVTIQPTGEVEIQYHFEGGRVENITAWLKEAENAGDIISAPKPEPEEKEEEEVPIGESLTSYDRMSMRLMMVA